MKKETEAGRAGASGVNEIAFDAGWYVATYPDVADSGMEPLEHFLKFGRAMGRPGYSGGPRSRLAPATSAEVKKAMLLADQFRRGQHRSVPVPEGAEEPIVAAPADWQPVPPGRDLGRPPAVGDALRLMMGDTEIGRFATMDDLAHTSGPVIACGRLLREGGTDAFRLQAASGACMDPERYLAALAAGPIECGGLDWLQNAWYPDDGHLRLALRSTPGSAPAGVLRVYQLDPADPETCHLIGGVELTGEEGLLFCDLPLANPLMPILFECMDRYGYSQAFGLLPFPSLLRGGLHAAERAAHQVTPDPMSEVRRLGTALLRELLLPAHRDAGFAVGRIEVDLSDATGAEPIFSASVGAWLAAVFGLSVRPAAGTAPDRAWLCEALTKGAPGPAKERNGALILSLPADSVPTLGALVSRRLKLPNGTETASGPFLLAEAWSRKPLWSVALPASAVSDRSLPGLRSLAGAVPSGAPSVGSWLAPLHLAIFFQVPQPIGDIRRLIPVAPDTPIRDRTVGSARTLALALEVTGPDLAMRFLSSLASQPGARVSDILLRHTGLNADDIARITALAKSLFPGVSVQSGPGGDGIDLDRVAEALVHDRILLAEDCVVLYDLRTLQCLLDGLETHSMAASVACAVLQDPEFREGAPVQIASAGLFPAQISLATAPRLTVFAPDCLDALPFATYPVLANTFHLCLLRRSAILATRAARAEVPGGTAADLKFGLDGLAAGWHNLCTTKVRAGTTGILSSRDEIDPFGLACILPARWDEVLGDVTLLRRLGR